jgi:RNA polymerase sigma factor (sigma-70 family)
MGRQGDERFERFVGSRTPALLRYARVLTGDPVRAATLVQASLAHSARRWREVEDDGGESAVQQQVLQRYLAAQRANRSDPGADAGEQLRDWVPDPQQAAEAGRARLVELVDALEPRRRAVLVLRHVHGLDDEEIADRTGLKTRTVAEVDCGAATPWVEGALCAHEGEGADPGDPVDWVNQRVGGDRRRAALVAVVGVVLLVLGAATVVPHLGRPSAELVSGLPPSGTGLLRWPTAGELATDALRLGKATDAWTDLAERGERPEGPIYALVSDTFRGIPMVVLEATDEAGDPRVALLVGYEPSLAASDVLTPGSATDALFLPASLVAGIPRVFGDVQNDGLILAPRWRGDDAQVGQEVGWQHISPSPIPSALPSLDADVSTWQPLDLLAGSNWLALLSNRAEGVVVLGGRAAGGAMASLKLPEPGSESLVLERDDLQQDGPWTAGNSASR